MVKSLGRVILRLTQVGVFILCGATTMSIFAVTGWIISAICATQPLQLSMLTLLVIAYIVGKIAFQGFDD